MIAQPLPILCGASPEAIRAFFIPDTGSVYFFARYVTFLTVLIFRKG